MANFKSTTNPTGAIPGSKLGGGSGGGIFDMLSDIPLDLAIPGAGAVIGLIGSLFGSGEKNDALMKALAELSASIPELSKGAFDKGELLGYGEDIRKNMATSGDVAATRAATSISEATSASGVPEGQGKNSMYVSEVAPIKAQGIQAGEQSFMNILSLIESMDSKAKARLFGALSKKVDATMGLDDMNDFGKGVAGMLEGGNLGMTFLGNYGDYTKNKNYKPPTLV